MYTLALEAKRLGIPVHVRRKPFNRRDRRTAVTWKLEVIIAKSKLQNRYRDLKTGRFIKKPC